MAGVNDNLIPACDRSPEEQRRIAQMGGIASGKAKRRKKSMQEAARALLEAPLLADDDPAVAAALEQLGLDADQQSAILLAAAQKSKAGDIEAARFVRDTSGQSPSKAVELSGPGGGPIESIDLSQLSDDQLSALLAKAEQEEQE